MLKFLYNKPALLCNGILILADLHIGIEREFFEKGIRIGKMIEENKKEIMDLINETKCRKLILLGDVKHRIPGISASEETEMSDFLNERSKHAELLVIKGNHDGELQKFAGGNIKVYEAGGIRIGSISLNHGHSWPTEEMMQADYLIMAHNHPSIELVDKLGYRTISRVWVIGKLDSKRLEKRYKKFNKNIKVVIMPAFNELVGGLSFNKHKARELLGPLFKNEIFKLEDAEIYLLSGIDLGKVRNLRY